MYTNIILATYLGLRWNRSVKYVNRKLQWTLTDISDCQFSEFPHVTETYETCVYCLQRGWLRGYYLSLNSLMKKVWEYYDVIFLILYIYILHYSIVKISENRVRTAIVVRKFPDVSMKLNSFPWLIGWIYIYIYIYSDADNRGPTLKNRKRKKIIAN